MYSAGEVVSSRAKESLCAVALRLGCSALIRSFTRGSHQDAKFTGTGSTNGHHAWQHFDSTDREKMIKIGGQRVPTWTILLWASDTLSIILGLLVATSLRFLSFRATISYLKAPHTALRFGLVVLAAG